jgi:formylglycine-generating enzyme required for sulfatase activity
VEQVCWEDVQQFIKKLNQIEKIKDYRLPSEAEWEYACRAGSETEFFSGDDVKGLDEFAWYSENSEDKTHPVGEKKLNAWGLYDMHGNVWEWVEDDWHGSYEDAPNAARTWVDNPRSPDRVLRSGGWFSAARGCRSARRITFHPYLCYFIVGFRLARTVALGP